MVKLRGGLTLALYPRSELAKGAAMPLGPPASGEFSLGHIIEKRGDVDAVLAQAERAGASISEAPAERSWGIYSGYFRDPDAHLWEIISSPPR